MKGSQPHATTFVLGCGPTGRTSWWSRRPTVIPCRGSISCTSSLAPRGTLPLAGTPRSRCIRRSVCERRSLATGRQRNPRLPSLWLTNFRPCGCTSRRTAAGRSAIGRTCSMRSRWHFITRRHNRPPAVGPPTDPWRLRLAERHCLERGPQGTSDKQISGGHLLYIYLASLSHVPTHRPRNRPRNPRNGPCRPAWPRASLLWSTDPSQRDTAPRRDRAGPADCTCGHREASTRHRCTRGTAPAADKARCPNVRDRAGTAGKGGGVEFESCRVAAV